MAHHIVYKPHERPDVEVLVDGVWFPGELRMWTQRDDGTWSADVRWSEGTGASSRLDTFPADQIRPVLSPRCSLGSRGGEHEPVMQVPSAQGE